MQGLLPALEGFLLSGRAAELVLLVVFAEFLILLLRWRNGGTPPRVWLSPLVAGAALVSALRLSQGTIGGGADAQWIGLALSIAGAAHLAGWRQRWCG